MKEISLISKYKHCCNWTRALWSIVRGINLAALVLGYTYVRRLSTIKMTFCDIHINRLKLLSIERLFAPWMFTYQIIIMLETSTLLTVTENTRRCAPRTFRSTNLWPAVCAKYPPYPVFLTIKFEAQVWEWRHRLIHKSPHTRVAIIWAIMLRFVQHVLNTSINNLKKLTLLSFYFALLAHPPFIGPRSAKCHRAASVVRRLSTILKKCFSSLSSHPISILFG